MRTLHSLCSRFNHFVLCVHIIMMLDSVTKTRQSRQDSNSPTLHSESGMSFTTQICTVPSNAWNKLFITISIIGEPSRLASGREPHARNESVSRYTGPSRFTIVPKIMLPLTRNQCSRVSSNSNLHLECVLTRRNQNAVPR